LHCADKYDLVLIGTAQSQQTTIKQLYARNRIKTSHIITELYNRTYHCWFVTDPALAILHLVNDSTYPNAKYMKSVQ